MRNVCVCACVSICIHNSVSVCAYEIKMRMPVIYVLYTHMPIQRVYYICVVCMHTHKVSFRRCSFTTPTHNSPAPLPLSNLSAVRAFASQTTKRF